MDSSLLLAWQFIVDGNEIGPDGLLVYFVTNPFFLNRLRQTNASTFVLLLTQHPKGLEAVNKIARNPTCVTPSVPERPLRDIARTPICRMGVRRKHPHGGGRNARR